MRPPGNKVYLTIPSALQEYTAGGLVIPGWLDREKFANTEAFIHSVGDKCKMPVSKGDKVYISYHALFQYDTTDSGVVTYRNQHVINGETVWVTDDVNLFAVVNLGIVPLGDWVFMKPIKELDNVSAFSAMLGNVQYATLAPVKGEGEFCFGWLGGFEIGWPHKDTLWFNEAYRSNYTMPDGMEYIIMPKRLIQAVINKEGMKLLGNRVLARELPEQKTGDIKSMLVAHSLKTAEVLFVGNKVDTMKPGDVIKFPKGIDSNRLYNGENVLMIDNADQIISILEPTETLI